MVIQLNKTILIIEGDANTTTFYEVNCPLGLKIITCDSGEEGVLKYVENMPNLVIINLELPKMSGPQAILEIKEFDRNAKIIIITDKKTCSPEFNIIQKMYMIPLLISPPSIEQILKIMEHS